MDTVNNFLSEYAIHDYVQYFFNACMILLIFGAIINKLFPDVDKSTDEETDMWHLNCSSQTTQQGSASACSCTRTLRTRTGTPGRREDGIMIYSIVETVTIAIQNGE
jgi:hypothetical protein